ncbi:hypothetical protein ABB37_07963 [Leptomonas pyrrhocoris]|uniref:Leucine-rich repeat protein (LRRP) n=1 Tax=Leptomonas pyrrhocoris TaxID=157538 RepID=A0A0M9FU96_LEPPY|nr:hypothetical protein ABB37_07963 [Leptomonas pyrrhocoris]KPA76215.1 hypothetical protein ABB37_07963 [Leptomonas pyrrhocoris]|eukprot:XP_015654654.1 hypothetical protein ABB37_07963 [Leptomonas pyrrhocoris]
MNVTLRAKRVPVNPAAAESEFHQIRTQEQLRSNALVTLGASEDQVAPSYFTSSLQEMAAQRLADDFADNCEVDGLREEQPDLYAMVLERLPTDPATMLPLRITVPRIMDERYWQRCCEARWPLGQLSRMVAGEKLLGKEYGWKRLFLERVLCDFLMSLGSTSADKEGGLLPATALTAPGAVRYAGPAALGAAVTCTAYDADATRFDLIRDDAAVTALRELCAICRDYVHTVDLPCQLVHFRFHEHLFAHVPGILSFRLTYGVAKRGVRVGVSDMIGFRDDDAAGMRQLLRHYSSLERLRLPLNRLQDRHVQMIAAGLVHSTTLRVLDLSQNALTDVAVAGAVAVLLSRPDFPLEELYLQDNRLGNGAASALAEALQLNKTLRILSLQQNCIGDAEGGALLVQALSVQPTLVDVNLSNNRLGKSTLSALASVLPRLSRLSVLRVAGNSLLAGAKIPSSGPGTPVSAEGSTTAVAIRSAPSFLVAVNDTAAPTAAGSVACESVKDSVADADNDAATASVTMVAGPDTPKGSEPRWQSTTMITLEVAHAGEGSTGKGKKEVAGAAAADMEHTEGGAVLCDAVGANKSLVELDVRFCGFTPDEEKAMMGGVQQRVFRCKMETAVAGKEAEQLREVKRRAEERVARMTGRVV